MKCTKCGAAFEDGQVFCPVCGTEIQLVPDFFSSETVSYAKKQKEREERERERRRKEEERRIREEEAMAEKKRQDRLRRKKIGIVVLAAIILGAAIFAFKSYQDMKNYNSYDYQLGKAEALFSNSHYEEALVYAERAVNLKAGSLDARVLLAQIYLKTGAEEKAVHDLEKIISENPDYAAAYGPLIRQYESDDAADKIKELLDRCKSDNIKERYAGYICESPEFGLPTGSYDELPTLTITAADKDDTIYYTMDGTEPDLLSDIYRESFLLEEGTVTVKAMAVNEKGIKSDVVHATYSISVAPPEPPKITPSSGSYTTAMKNTKIYVIVPSGCQAYYCFDKPATKDDMLYEGPVEMPEGEHTFYAVLVNEYGKVSVAGSATYILKAEDSQGGERSGEDTAEVKGSTEETPEEKTE